MAKKSVSNGAVTYRIAIEGASPLYMNQCPPIMPKQGKGRKKMDPEDILGEWRQKAYFADGVGLYIPSSYIEGTIREAAGNWRLKKDVPASFFCTDDMIPLTVPDTPAIASLDDIEKLGWVDRNNVKMKAAGGSMVLRSRPKIPAKWRATFTLVCAQPDLFGAELVAEILEFAGKFKGIGDWRPKYGRFNVLSIKEV